jgi:hypothetical protein
MRLPGVSPQFVMMMTRGAGSELYHQTLFPIAWSIARGFRLGTLANPFEWMKATRLPGESQTLADTLERALTREDEYGSLTSWVLRELPQGQAHFIDTDTDSIWAFLLLMAIRSSAADGRVPSIRVGSGTYSRRDDIRTAIEEIGKRDVEIAREFQLRDLSSTILPNLRRVLDAAFDDFARAESNEILAAPLSEKHVQRLRASVRSHWAESFPRNVLTPAGSVLQRSQEGPSDTRFGISAHAPKLFLIAESNAVGDAPEVIGSSLGEGIGRGESDRLVEKILMAKTYRYAGSVQERILRGFASLSKQGTPATHCLFPPFWNLRIALEGLGPRPSGADGNVWEFEGIQMVEWHEWDDDSLVVLSLPRAITIQQFRVNGEVGVEVQVTEVASEAPAADLESFDHMSHGQEPAVDPPKREVAVRIDAFEKVRFRVNRRYVRRVALPKGFAEP